MLIETASGDISHYDSKGGAGFEQRPDRGADGPYAANVHGPCSISDGGVQRACFVPRAAGATAREQGIEGPKSYRVSVNAK
jgi:hypothetical protein